MQRSDDSGARTERRAASITGSSAVLAAVPIVLITGLPGTGKTTLGRALMERYSWPLLAKDVIKEGLLDTLGAADAAASRRLSDASFAVMFALARDGCLGGLPGLILEGNFRPGEHEGALRAALPALFEPAGDGPTLQLAQILCRMPDDERRARLARRQADPSRHPGHADALLVAAASPPAGDSFLELPGERFVHDGAAVDTVLQRVEDWLASRA